MSSLSETRTVSSITIDQNISVIKVVDDEYLPCCGILCIVCQSAESCCPSGCNCEFLGCLSGCLCFEGWCDFMNNCALGKCRRFLNCKCESCKSLYHCVCCVGEKGECCECNNLSRCFSRFGCNLCYHGLGCYYCCPCLASCCVVDELNMAWYPKVKCCDCSKACSCERNCSCFGKDGCCGSMCPEKICTCLPRKFCCGCSFEGCSFPCNSCASAYCNFLSIDCACGSPFCSDVPCILNILGCNICYRFSCILGCQNNIGQLNSKLAVKNNHLIE